LGILLLGFIGCTKVLEHRVTPVSSGGEAAHPAVATNGFLSDFPTEQPASPDAIEQSRAALEPTLRVHEIQLAHREGRQALILVLSRPPARVRSFGLRDPNRVVLDLDGPLAPIPTQTHAVADPGIARVRIGAHEGQLRVVIDANGALPEIATDQDGRVVVALLGAARSDSKDQLVYRAVGLPPATMVATSHEPAAETAASTEPESAVAYAGDASTTTAHDFAAAESPVAPEAEPLASAPPAVDSATAADAPPRTDDLALADSPTYTDDVPAGKTPEHALDVDVVDEATHEAALADARAYADELAARDARRAALDEPPVTAARGDVDTAPPAVSTKDDLSLHEPPVDEPKTYALPLQATAKSESRKTTASVTHTVEGGTVQQLGTTVSGPREYTGQRISLDFKDADIQNVLRILADVSGLNIITTEEVHGKLTMRLVDVPWDQAFDAILRAKNLDSIREGNIIRVSTVEQLKKERDAQRAADEAQKQVEPLEVKYIKVNYAKADEKMVKKIQEVLTDRGSATWDERTNMIVVRDIARGVADAAELVSQFDTQTPQILIESNIVEAQQSFVRDLGIQWGYSYKAGPGTGNAPGVNFPGTVGAGGVLAGGKNSPATTVPFIADFPAASVAPGAGAAYDFLLGSLDGASSLNARLTALERDGKVKIISRPRVVTLNNLPATIESLRILRVRLPSTGTVIATGAGGAAGSAQNATEQIKTGITLTVTPQVSSDGFIFLDVFAKSSTTAPSSVVASDITIPDEVSRQAESHVLIKDGDTFVLGGVFQNTLNRNDQGVPYLRSIPVIGWAFKNHSDTDDRQELLVFITPKTVAGRGSGSSEDFAKLPSAANLWQNRPH
jgi:type IV pilus assembly protein PilQ